MGKCLSDRRRAVGIAAPASAAVPARSSKARVLAHAERVGEDGQGEVLVLGVDGVAAVGAVPLGDGGVGLHLLEDVPPAGAGVVGAEADLAELGAVGDDAHLGAAEIVVEQILEPHPRHEEDAPLVLFGVALARVCGAALAKELPEQRAQVEAGRGLLGVVVAEEARRHLGDGPAPAAARREDGCEIGEDALHVEEVEQRHHLPRALVDEEHGADAAVGVAAAVELAPVFVGPVEQVDHVAEGRERRQREPVPIGARHAGLLGDVVRKVAQRVALLLPQLVRDVLVAAGEAHRLEADHGDLVGVLHGELDDGPDLIVVQAVDDRHHQDDVDAGGAQLLDGAELHVVEVLDLAVAVGLVGDAVELEVGHAEAGLLALLGEAGLLGEAEPVGGALDGEVALLPGVADGVEEVGRERGLAAGELDRHLPPGLHLRRVVEDLGDLVPGELVDVADLVGVHEARVAHHVAAVGQVDREHRAAPVLDGAGAVVVDAVGRHGHVAPGEEALDPREEAGVDGDQILEAPVLGAGLLHHHLAGALHDARPDLARLVGEEAAPVGVAAEDLGARLLHAGRAEAVRLARPAQGGPGPLRAAGDGLVAPARVKGRRGRGQPVYALHHRPRGSGRKRDDLLQGSDGIHQQPSVGECVGGA